VLQKFFEQAVKNNDVPGVTKLILENIDEVGELCESLVEEENLLTATLPQTADTLLTWGVEHNKYELVQFIIERGRQHITNNLRKCVGKRVTKIAAQKGYRKLFLLLINNAVDVDTRNITAFMSAIICSEYELAQAMIRLGEYRLEQPDQNGYTPLTSFQENFCLQIPGDKERKKQKEALEALLRQKIKTMNQNKPRKEQQALLKKEQ
jgi:ankyrin repeat protein